MVGGLVGRLVGRCVDKLISHGLLLSKLHNYVTAEDLPLL